MRGVSTETTSTGKTQRRGPELTVLRELLAAGQSEEVVALVGQLVARNAELERKLGAKGVSARS